MTLGGGSPYIELPHGVQNLYSIHSTHDMGNVFVTQYLTVFLDKKAVSVIVQGGPSHWTLEHAPAFVLDL